MKTSNPMFPWLELINGPAFCVKDGTVIAVNSAAAKRMIQIGTDVHQIVTQHQAEYETFQNGELYLTVSLGDCPCNATILRTDDCDIFRIHTYTDDDTLQALALAAVQLRIPLANAMSAADDLLRNRQSGSSDTDASTGQLNRNLFRLMRIVSNMADAECCRTATPDSMQTVNFTAFMGEIAEKVQTLCANSGVTLAYTGPDSPVFGLASSEKLERAVYNLFSNALKFSPAGSTVQASLTKNGKQLTFTVINHCAKTPSAGSFWTQHQREPAIEDPRSGLGLGMTLVSSVAAMHGGTVLIDRPTADTVRITMTIPINSDPSGTVRSPVMRISDYTGGWDKGLMELAEILPIDAYSKSE